VVLASTIRQY